ncbi:arrestin domain-containing protein 4-like [Armigeres subalbatus]|uniref:arrestin domain-containing protein 4-like n=1 Tax=Armigeres subalbatus TaxID=124917 RepID=UPI002ED41F93
MTITCDIRYDNNPQGIFYVGQTLSGSVVLQASEPEPVNVITVKIEGFTVVQWTERRPPHGKRHRSRQFNGRQDYFNTLINLLGTEHAPAITIPQGTNVYKFSCSLPDSLPTSFEGQYGHIRYTITVVIERPSQQDTTYREAFTVLRNVNLNDTPSLRDPKMIELSKTSGWWIFKSDPMDITVEIPCTGYVSGQSIPVVVRWKNNNAAIRGIRIKLHKHETYSATEPYEKSRTDSHSTVKIENRDHQQDVDGTFERSLLIPSLPPSSVSPLIVIAYELTVYVHLSADDIPSFKVPITIGTIPLVALPPSARPPPPSGGDDPDQPPGYPPSYGFKFDGVPSDGPADKAGSSSASTTTAATGSTLVPDATSSAPMQQHDLPPPTYEEAMSTVTNTDGDEGPAPMDPNKPFIPLYPVYNFGDPGSGQQ